MIGTLVEVVQKVSDIENKYEKLRGKVMDEDADSVCEDSRNTAPGRGEEDACSSISAKGRDGDTQHHGLTGLALMITKVQTAAPRTQ